MIGVNTRVRRVKLHSIWRDTTILKPEFHFKFVSGTIKECFLDIEVLHVCRTKRRRANLEEFALRTAHDRLIVGRTGSVRWFRSSATCNKNWIYIVLQVFIPDHE